MEFDDKDVAEIERLFADLTVPVTAIARRFHCAPMTLARLAERKGWPSRSERRGWTAKPRLAKAPKAQAGLMMRLCRAATKQLEQMEQGMENGTMSAADYERLAKSVGAIIGGMEKVAAVQDGGDKKRRAGKPRAVSDAERRRREIAERLERLALQRMSQRGSGEPR